MKAEGDEMEIDDTYFTWLSDVGDYEEIPLGEFGAQVLRTEDVYTDAGECEPGDRIGVLYIEETETGRGGRVLVTATFDFENEEDTLVVRGIAQRVLHHDRPSFAGRLGIGGGTGRFKDRRGQVDVDLCNPKRWSA